MKIADVPLLEQKTLEMLPITQAEMWKKLGISHRDGSKLVKLLLNKNLIKREKVKGTFLLEKMNGSSPTGENKKRYSVLLSDTGKFSPCTGCQRDCNVQNCNDIIAWITDE